MNSLANFVGMMSGFLAPLAESEPEIRTRGGSQGFLFTVLQNVQVDIRQQCTESAHVGIFWYKLSPLMSVRGLVFWR